ncbi:MAG TPA: glucose-6-phosphate dehydrogenase, partial [Clostridia bacterium]|nr:glucose-6-phosphate dehydrogenase [Clostridia bacterium]
MKNILTIFGGSGNLAYLKLYPALLNLDRLDQLPDSFRILAAARSKRSNEEFRLEIKKRLQLVESDPIILDRFLERITYISLSFKDLEDYSRLKKRIDTLDSKYSIENNRIFYLATSPDFFSIITKNLSDQNMINQETGNQKIVIEKPFGTDFESAKDLNDHLLEFIHEEDIYRIDHYLGKDMIANILYLRFSNPIFSGVWNKDYIDNVQIVASEEIGIQDRGRYYDDSGALRDMVQNHLLQILGTVAMEMPD